MLLVIDVGNSNIVLGVYDGLQLVRNWRLSTDKSRTSDEYAVLLHSLFAQCCCYAFYCTAFAVITPGEQQNGTGKGRHDSPAKFDPAGFMPELCLPGGACMDQNDRSAFAIALDQQFSRPVIFRPVAYIGMQR